MKNEFVTYKQALALKELGFNEDCFGYYENQNEHLVIIYNNSPLTEEQKKRPGLYVIDNKNSSLPQWATSAPLKQQVFRWFEDKHSIFVERKIFTTPNEILHIDYSLKSWKFQPIQIEFENPYDSFDREKAESACIDKLIEIIKK